MIESMRDSTDEGNGESQEEDDGEWEGFAEPPAVDYEAEYIDEDKYTTVTVEDLDPSKEDEDTKRETEERNGEKASDQKAQNPTSSIPRKTARAKGKPDKSKSKKKFRYENKADRKVSRVKSRVANGAKAKERRGK